MTRVLPLLDKSHTISSVIGLGRSYSNEFGNEFGGGGKKVGMIAEYVNYVIDETML